MLQDANTFLNQDRHHSEGLRQNVSSTPFQTFERLRVTGMNTTTLSNMARTKPPEPLLARNTTLSVPTIGGHSNANPVIHAGAQHEAKSRRI
jgi:hypothetical protein